MPVRGTREGPSFGRLGPIVGSLALVLLVACLRLGFLRRHSLGNNEFITLRVLALPYAEIARERPSRNHLPCYFLALRAWTQAFGTSEVALRLPSALAVLGGALAAWRLAAFLYGRPAGLLALGLCGLNSLQQELATDARMYGWLFLATALAVGAFVRYAESGRRRWAALLAAAGLFGLGVQVLFGLVLGVLAGYVLARGRAFRGRRAWLLLALGLPVVVWLPQILLLGQVEDKVGRQHPWRGFLLLGALREVEVIFLGDHKLGGRGAAQCTGAVLLAACVGVTLAAGWRARRGAEGGAAAEPAGAAGRYVGLFWLLVLAPLLAVPLAGMRSTRQMVGSWRYYVTAAPVAPLLFTAAAAGLWRRGWRAAAVGFAALVALVAGGNLVGFLLSPGRGVREVALHVRADRQPGDLVATSRKEARTRGFLYYGAVESWPREQPPDLDEPDAVEAWLRVQCEGARRLWMVFYHDEPGESTVAAVLARHPDLVVPVGALYRVGDTSVQLYDFRPPPRPELPGRQQSREEGTPDERR